MYVCMYVVWRRSSSEIAVRSFSIAHSCQWANAEATLRNIQTHTRTHATFFQSLSVAYIYFLVSGVRLSSFFWFNFYFFCVNFIFTFRSHTKITGYFMSYYTAGSLDSHSTFEMQYNTYTQCDFAQIVNYTLSNIYVCIVLFYLFTFVGISLHFIALITGTFLDRIHLQNKI